MKFTPMCEFESINSTRHSNIRYQQIEIVVGIYPVPRFVTSFLSYNVHSQFTK